MSESQHHPVFITLGSNIDPETNLPEAVRRLRDRFTIKAVSRVYESAPLDASGQVMRDQGVFLNAAVLIDTDLSPAALKYDVLRPIENQLGRVRTGDKFAPRTIDLDIALVGAQVIDNDADHLHIPDPDIERRAHVALPLADLAPDFRHPVSGRTLAAIAAPFRDQPGITPRDDIDLSACAF